MASEKRRVAVELKDQIERAERGQEAASRIQALIHSHLVRNPPAAQASALQPEITASALLPEITASALLPEITASALQPEITVLLCEFDIDVGSTLKMEYPAPLDCLEAEFLSELCLPEVAGRTSVCC